MMSRDTAMIGTNISLFLKFSGSKMNFAWQIRFYSFRFISVRRPKTYRESNAS